MLLTNRVTACLQSVSLRSACLLAVFLGVVNVLAFAPFFVWPVQIVTLAVMFSWLSLRPDWTKKQLALLGFCFGFGLMFAGVSWLLISMTRFGGMPVVAAIFALAAFTAYLALFPALALAVGRFLQQRWRVADNLLLLLILPALWGIAEYLRGTLLTGFPWLSFGYAHQISPLSGFAPLLGVYGLGGLAALLAGAFALLLLHRVQRRLSLFVLFSVLIAGLALRQVAWTTPHGNEISVRLVQTNIDQGAKFDEAFFQRILQEVANAIMAQPADLIAIPETAIPVTPAYLPPDYLPRLQHFAQQSASHIFVGLVMEDAQARYSNSIVGVSPDPTLRYRYDKHHLVPFGEFVPWGFRWLVDMMHIPLGDQVSMGVLQNPMQVKDQRVMPNICYEDLFGDEIALQLRMQQEQGEAAHILLNLSNLAWFGDSLAIPQHGQISQMRAMETGRPMLRSTNTGATAIIDEHGQVQAQLASQTQANLSGKVQGMSGLTPYVRFGDAIAAVLAAIALLIAWAKRP